MVGKERSLEARRRKGRQAKGGPASVDAPPAASPPWGRVPVLALAMAVGVALVASANALTRTGREGGESLFWLGLFAIVIPTMWRVSSAQASRSERLVLVILASLAMYGVKVIHDPFGFTFADELIHQHNADEILRTARLFGDNSLLPITPFYPGLEAVTAAVAALTGLSTFGAGLLVVGVARVILAVAIVLVVEGVFRSSRAGAVASLLYIAAPNYLYWSAQFSYESLALPIGLLVLAMVVKWRHASTSTTGWGWNLIGVSLVPAIAVTHHLTSYAMLALLGLLCIFSLLASRLLARRHGPERIESSLRPPWLVTGAMALVVLCWIGLAGHRTTRYISPVLTKAVEQTLQVASQEAPSRRLFNAEASATSDTYATGPLEKIVALGSVAVLVLWIPLAVLTVRRRLKRDALLAVMALCALAYLGTFPLRFVPAAWETAIRASDFLFVGVAGVLAGMGLHRRAVLRIKNGGAILVCGAATILMSGGVIGGWPPGLRLSAPYRIAASVSSVDPPGVALGRWSRENIGTDNRIAAEEADARTLLEYGDQEPIAGRSPDVRGMLHSRVIDPWMIDMLIDRRFSYVAVDHRRVSADSIAGQFFDRPGSASATLFHSLTIGKFDRQPGAQRIFDTGSIVLYDVRGLAR